MITIIKRGAVVGRSGGGGSGGGGSGGVGGGGVGEEWG